MCSFAKYYKISARFLVGSRSPKTLNTLQNYIRSMLDYGCYIYFPTQKELMNYIEKMQYSAVRFGLGYRMSTPTNIFLSESK